MSTTHPLHIIFVEVAATMTTSPFIKLWKIFHPTACWILAHCCLSIHSPRQNEHFRQLNGTSKPEIETAYYNIPIVNRKKISLDKIVTSWDLDKKCDNHENKWWISIKAHIYNESFSNRFNFQSHKMKSARRKIERREMNRNSLLFN